MTTPVRNLKLVRMVSGGAIGGVAVPLAIRYAFAHGFSLWGALVASIVAAVCMRVILFIYESTARRSSGESARISIQIGGFVLVSSGLATLMLRLLIPH